MIDTRNPSIKNSMRIDSKSGRLMDGHAICNKRNLIRTDDDKLVERVKFVVKEGAMLTMIGKITYNVETD